MFNKVGIIIPALNEADTLGAVIVKIKGALKKCPQVKKFSIVLVDDGSTDRTTIIAKKEGCSVVRHSQNEGYDSALNDGFSRAAKNGCDLFITMDADGQHDPSNLCKFIDSMEKMDADVIVGVRPHKQRISEYFLGAYAMQKMGVKDPLCGFKAYRKKVYASVGYFDSFKSIGLELLFQADKKGFKIGQMPVILHERKDIPRFGRSLKGNFRILRALWLLFLRFGF